MPCVVCGDKVHGMNFNALTCMSCKAFFRRNALRNKEFQCLMKNSCEMTPIKRKFCTKCRLDKCFAVGMKKEWIQADGSKALSKKKLLLRQIECDPTYRELFQSYFDKKSDQTDDCSKDESLCPSNSSVSENKTDFVNQTFASLTDAEIDQMLLINIELENYLSRNNLEQNGLLVDLIHDSVFDESEDLVSSNNRQNMDFITLCLITDYETYDLDGNIFDAPQLYTQICNPSNELLSEEQFKLTELMSAYLLLRNPYKRQRHLSHYLPAGSGKVSQYIFARLTRMCHKFYPFGLLDTEQQRTLMQSKFLKMLIIRSVLLYNPENDCLDLFDDHGKVTVLIPFEIFKRSNQNICVEHHRNYHKLFRHEWKQDEIIFALLTAIVLFKPEPESTNNLNIRNEYTGYVYLLKRYLELKYPSQSEAHECLSQLMHNINEMYSICADLQSFFDYRYQISVQDNPRFGQLLQLDTRDWE